jgi:uncharacterized membrane-anchored protein
MSCQVPGLNLGLDPSQLESLRDAIEKGQDYKSTQERMRAAVLLCAQGLMNATQFPQEFQRILPNIKNAAIAVAAAADFLRSKGLLHTLSVLQDEIDPEVLRQGQEELAVLLQDAAPGDHAIAQVRTIAAQ